MPQRSKSIASPSTATLRPAAAPSAPIGRVLLFLQAMILALLVGGLLAHLRPTLPGRVGSASGAPTSDGLGGADVDQARMANVTAAADVDQAPGDDDPPPCPRRDPTTGQPTTVLTLNPSRIALCERSTFSLRVRADCADPRHDLVLVVDRSGSMLGAGIADAKEALLGLLGRMVGPGRPSTRVAVLSHGAPPTLDQDFTADVALLNAAVGRLDVASSTVADDLPGAIDEASRRILAEDAGAPALRTLLLLSDGGQSHAAPQVLAAADRAQAAGLLIVSVCVSNPLSNCALMRQLASRTEWAFEADGRVALLDRLQRASSDLTALVAGDVTVRAALPEGLQWVPGSASPAPDDSGRWHWPWLAADGVTLTWQVEAQREGVFTIPTPEVLVGAGSDKPYALDAAGGSLEVAGTCGRPSVTPGVTVTPEATPTPTTTPRPVALWLPNLLAGTCIKQGGGLDVLLLLDTSSSMDAPTRAGRSKLTAAADAVRAMTDVLGPADRLGLLAFDATARLEAQLATDPSALIVALGNLHPSPGTRIDLALEAADAAFAAAEARPASRQVVILLTDGRTDDGSADAAVAAAAALRNGGRLIRVIGLGADLDLGLLAAIAGDGANLSQTEDAESLAAVYQQTVALLPCR